MTDEVPTPEELIESFQLWQSRAKRAARIAIACFLALLALSTWNLLRGEDTRSDAGKTQAGVDRTTRTIQKVRDNAAGIRALARQLDNQLQLSNERFGQLLALLNALGIDTTTIDRGGRIAPDVSRQGQGAVPSGGSSGGGGSGDRGGDGGGGPPGEQPSPPAGGGGGNPDLPSDPPPAPGPRPQDPPSVGGLGLDVPAVDECQLAPVLCP